MTSGHLLNNEHAVAFLMCTIFCKVIMQTTVGHKVHIQNNPGATNFPNDAL